MIDHRLFLPDQIEVPAWFDFASMIIGTSYTRQEVKLDEAWNTRADYYDLVEPAMVVMHEHKHFLQAISMPFFEYLML